jgi:hypothetical protein
VLRGGAIGRQQLRRYTFLQLPVPPAQSGYATGRDRIRAVVARNKGDRNMTINPKLLAAVCTAGLFAATAFAMAPGEHEWLEAFDADRNGLFNPTEIEAAAGRIFARADADGDGRITAQEARALHEGRGPRELDGDTDGDGALSLAEFRTDIRRHVQAADANRDGQLSMQELEAMHGRR